KKAIRILAQYYRYHGDNVTEGLNWIRKAADEAGSAAAAYWMAEAFIGKGGWGIPADLDQCGYYLDLADKSGEFPKSVAALREELDEKLLSASERRFAADDVRAMIHQMEKSGSTVFTIPYGFTHVDGRDRYYDMNKPLSKVTELVLPDTLISIGDWSFEGFVSLTKVNIPRRLKYIGEGAFASKRLGMFNRMVSGKNIIEALTIPLKTELVKYSLGDIPGIRMLRFEEGRTELDWEIFHSLWMTAEIEELHIPDSLTKIHNPDAYVNLNVKILYAPKHLETQINSIQRGKGFTKIGKIIYR
ncbi:MAG: leucine-rich repeat domain-containing protein, partial [Firmicutes bacterium]|nr:leucine-rich repeat domain-containing protein [Bacillota bacterium]